MRAWIALLKSMIHLPFKFGGGLASIVAEKGLARLPRPSLCATAGRIIERASSPHQSLARKDASDADPSPVKQLVFELSGQHLRRFGHERRQNFAERVLGSALRAVVNLECDSKAKLGQSRTMHALGAALHEDSRCKRRHDDGVKPALSRHEYRRSEAGRYEPLGHACTGRRQSHPGAKAREAARQGAERERPGRHRATIDAHARVVERHAASL